MRAPSKCPTATETHVDSSFRSKTQSRAANGQTTVPIDLKPLVVICPNSVSSVWGVAERLFRAFAPQHIRSIRAGVCQTPRSRRPARWCSWPISKELSFSTPASPEWPRTPPARASGEYSKTCFGDWQARLSVWAPVGEIRVSCASRRGYSSTEHTEAASKGVRVEQS